MRRIFLAVLVSAVGLTSLGGPARVAAQTSAPPPQIGQLFQQMTPEERVGQLFLVTFTGTDTSNLSQIYDLIVNHHVGGVVLRSDNDNFVAAPNTITSAYQLIRNLQQLEWDSASGATSPATGTSHVYVPLFVAMSQDGDGFPNDQVLSGLTPLPSAMAVGATWSPDIADKVGTVMGRELSALGINLYLGPSLDVLATPNPTSNGDLGSSVFGGDPYWVGQMGSAYIKGLHAGSNNRLLVIAKHFPGNGSSDRPIVEEVPTIRKSLDQLKQIELYPFFQVTGNAPTRDSMADGLLVSHIRYQGLQGNIRATTRPVSFDPQALSAILNLPQFSSWRNGGGLIMSDDLGTPAVRQYYATSTSFPARTVARDAFVAGNDLLYLGNIVSSDAPDNYSTVLEILDFFTQKYRTDPAFAQSVDASVLHLLTLKNYLYGSFNVQNVIVASQGLDAIGQSQDVTFEVARRAATLLSPDLQNLAGPPQVRDRIVFFTDTSPGKQCSTCPVQSGLPLNALQDAVVQLYGPQGGNQTSSFRLSSYTLEDAANYVAGKALPFLQDDLNQAGWVIFSLTDSSRNQPQVISNFLSAKQDLLRNKRVVLFAFGAPYYLDATDISRLGTYFGLYSKQSPFVEVAARLLFQELTPVGASPVSIPGLGYDLTSITSPDPRQIITLILDLSVNPAATNAPTPLATPVPLFKIGDTIAIRTGVIKDHNGQPVPDGTVVHFFMNLTGVGGGILQQADAITAQGVAHVSFGLDKPGLLQIRAASDPAQLSEVLQLDVSSGGQPAAVTVIVPLLTPAATAQAPSTPVPVQDQFVTSQGMPRFNAWLLTFLLLVLAAALAYWSGNRIQSRRWGVRWGLCTLTGGLVAYNYLALGLPGSSTFANSNGIGGIMAVTILGMAAGWGGGWIWSERANRL
jgi:beta-N-acetylhexosaminidase